MLWLLLYCPFVALALVKRSDVDVAVNIIMANDMSSSVCSLSAQVNDGGANVNVNVNILQQVNILPPQLSGFSTEVIAQACQIVISGGQWTTPNPQTTEPNRHSTTETIFTSPTETILSTTSITTTGSTTTFSTISTTSAASTPTFECTSVLVHYPDVVFQTENINISATAVGFSASDLSVQIEVPYGLTNCSENMCTWGAYLFPGTRNFNLTVTLVSTNLTCPTQGYLIQVDQLMIPYEGQTLVVPLSSTEGYAKTFFEDICGDLYLGNVEFETTEVLQAVTYNGLVLASGDTITPNQAGTIEVNYTKAPINERFTWSQPGTNQIVIVNI
jgi:hypothetical protein